MDNEVREGILKSAVACGDLFDVLIGKAIGVGQNRDVFEYKPDPDMYVIKYEGRGDFFQNAMEWRLWDEAKYFKVDKWFAPCWYISPNGRFLVQSRITFPPKNKYPDKLPGFFTDTKYGNFGLLGKKFVACDYGHPVVLKNNNMKQLRKVRWWQE